MASIHDLFTFYLKAEHLQGRSVTVHIESCTIEQVFNPRLKKAEPRLLIRFHGKKLGMLTNKTQAGVLARLTGTDDYTKWPGNSVMLTPGKAGSGQDTITVSGVQVAPTVQPPVHTNGDSEPAPTMHTDNPFEQVAQEGK